MRSVCLLGSRAAAATCVLALASACRGAVPAAGASYEDLAIAPGARFSSERTFVSVDSDLDPFTEQLRAGLGGSANLIGPGSAQWAFEGNVELFRPGTTPDHSASAQSRAVPTEFATPVTLYDEIHALAATPVLSGLFAGGGGSTDCPDSRPTDPDLLDQAAFT